MLSNKDSITIWLKINHITNCVIHDDLSVSVDGDVHLSYKGLVKIPLQFNSVSGLFDVSHNQLKSLDGSPRVCQTFNCSYNQLINLEGGPRKTLQSYYCNNNQITSLMGSPIEIYQNFVCHNNLLENLNYCTQHLAFLSCFNNPFKSLKGIEKIRIHDNTLKISASQLYTLEQVYYIYDFLKHNEDGFLLGLNDVNEEIIHLIGKEYYHQENLILEINYYRVRRKKVLFKEMDEKERFEELLQKKNTKKKKQKI